MAMEKVEILSHASDSRLEDQVNEWLSRMHGRIEITDRRMAMAPAGNAGTVWWSIAIFYRDKGGES